jgi:hypothetical protein
MHLFKVWEGFLSFRHEGWRYEKGVISLNEEFLKCD